MTFNEKHELMKSYVSIRCIQCQTITHYYHCIDWSEHECECGVKVGVVVKDRFTGNTNVVINDMVIKQPSCHFPNDLFTI